MSFSFNFLPPENEAEEPVNNSNSVTVPTTESKPFAWTENLVAKFRDLIALSPPPPHDWIAFGDDDNEEKAMSALARIRERSNCNNNYRGTDLVPGVYEGGDVVWECSVDLCRYLRENRIPVRGHVLELGCGHGLPGCWVLQQAKRLGDNSTHVFFTDFNEFVLDSTMSNIFLNVQPVQEITRKDVQQGSHQEDLALWLSQHAPLGSGDWNALSKLLEDASTDESIFLPEGVPRDGMFDFILAAETTYSTVAAYDTARFITKHLRRDTGVAYVATKRYYFGVGGGSDALREGIRTLAGPGGDVLDVETLQVYDNGAGNIRELLCVKKRRGA